MKRVVPVLLAPFLLACEPVPESALPDPGPRPVKVAEVRAGSDMVEYTYPALVLPAEEAELSFRVAGQIVDLPVRAMSQVKRGDLLARLDPRDYDTNVAQAEAQLAAERAKLDSMTTGARSEDLSSLRSGVQAAQAQVAAAQAQAERTLTDYRKGVVPKEKLDSDLAALKAAEAQVAAQQQELNKGRSGARSEDVSAQTAVIAGLEAQAAAASNIQTDTQLLAPFDGVIAERRVDNFANVQPKQTIMILQNLATLALSFDMPGPDVATLGARRDALSVVTVLDAVPDRVFPARLSEFTSRADPATQTFEGRIAIERPDDFVILPGMSGRVIVRDASGADTRPVIPPAALAAGPDGTPFVWVVGDDNRVERRDVTPGAALDDAIGIDAGLEPGEIVVTAGLSVMQPGLEVRPVTLIGGGT